MTDQAPLFDEDGVSQNRFGPFRSGSETSRQAALDNYARSGSQRREVYDAILESGHGGLTRQELSDMLGLRLSSVTGRVWELLKGGFIRDSGKRRPTETGSQAAVLVAVEDSP